MNVSPLDIKNKKFSKAVRGYNEEEVNAFLEELYQNHASLLQEHRDLVLKVMDLEDQLETFEQTEKGLTNTQNTSEEAVDNYLERAKKTANDLVQQAEEKANRILQSSFDEYQNACLNREKLQKEMTIYKTRMRLMLTSRLQETK